jgi:3-oxoacyl-[acyl-carrier protein] reductase
MNLKNKVVLVTGGSSGIGQAVATELAKLKAIILINYRKNKVGAVKTLKLIENIGTKGYVFKADVSSSIKVKEMFKQIKDKGLKVDILINNAGQSPAGDLDNLEMWESEFKNNFFSAVYCSNEFLKQKDNNELSKIINISSVYGFWEMGNPDYIQYVTAKAALNSLTYSLAKKLAPNVLVNAVAPGYTMTPNWNGSTDEEFKKGAELNKIKRFVKPEEIASMVVELLKNDAITGEVNRVDGGLHLQDIL